MTVGGSDGAGKCNYYNRTLNTTDPFSIRANYGGIPEALVINLLGWLALLVLFLVIRKNVFNVMSRGLQRNIGRVTEVLFRRDSLPDPESGSASEEAAQGKCSLLPGVEVERFRELLRQQSYVIKNQFKDSM